MIEYYCCDLHHSSYCPRCRGEWCEWVWKLKLSPKQKDYEKNAKKIEMWNRRVNNG